MKRLALGLLLAAAPAWAGPAAVIVGIGRYADPELSALQGPPEDARSMRRLLVDDYGFAPESVVTLIDADATREGILRALAAMTQRAAAGDPLVFYFSGHGTRVFDGSGDEPDGWDEGLVPHDSGRGGRPNLDIIDDELHAVLAGMVERGAQVTFVFDSCHAGSGTRDPGEHARSAPRDPRFRVISAAPGLRTDDLPQGWTLIAAARQDQLAYEKPLGPDGARRGLLTTTLVDALRAAPPGASLRDVFEPVRAAVRQREPRQDPQLEGPGADRLPFGVARETAAPYVPAEPMPDGARIEAGEAHGVAVGALYAIAAPGSHGPTAGDPLGRVVRVEATTARLELPPGIVVQPASRAFLRAPGAAGRRVPVHVDTAGWPLGEAVGQVLAHQPTVELLPPWARFGARIVVRADGDRLRIEGTDGPRDAIPMPSDAMSVARRVMPWVRWHAIDRLSSDHAVPVRFDVGSAPPGDDRAVARVKPGETLRLMVANDGSTDLYLTLMALGSDGAITVVYPLPGAREYVQAFGQWQQTVEAALPPGARRAEDRLVLIVTEHPSDFRFLQQGPAGAAAAKGVDGLDGLWSALEGDGAKSGGGRWAARALTIITAP